MKKERIEVVQKELFFYIGQRKITYKFIEKEIFLKVIQKNRKVINNVDLWDNLEYWYFKNGYNFKFTLEQFFIDNCYRNLNYVITREQFKINLNKVIFNGIQLKNNLPVERLYLRMALPYFLTKKVYIFENLYIKKYKQLLANYIFILSKFDSSVKVSTSLRTLELKIYSHRLGYTVIKTKGVVDKVRDYLFFNRDTLLVLNTLNDVSKGYFLSKLIQQKKGINKQKLGLKFIIKKNLFCKYKYYLMQHNKALEKFFF